MFLPVLVVFTAAFFIYSKLLVERYRVTNVSNPLYVSLFFGLWTLLLFFLFHDFAGAFFFFMISLPSLSILLLSYVVWAGLYRYVREHVPEPERLIAKESNQTFLQLRYTFLIGKSADILFQQLAFYILFMYTVTLFPNTESLLIAFAVFIAAVHIPLIFVQGLFWGLFYAIFSFVGGTIFALLIASFPYGVALSYVVHLGFYILAGVIAWLRYT